jgi:molybdate transport system permease protein
MWTNPHQWTRARSERASGWTSRIHTLGEFGVVLMVGGNIPGETKTIAIAIYDRVQAFDNAAAGFMSAVLLLISLLAISATFLISARRERLPGV